MSMFEDSKATIKKHDRRTKRELEALTITELKALLTACLAEGRKLADDRCAINAQLQHTELRPVP